MADTKISAMTSGGTVATTDAIPAVRAGANVRVLVKALATKDTADLTADVTGILPSANGGTANGFTKFSGPTTSEKTFTLPDASATILTSNALVTAAQGGTNNGFTQFTGPASSAKTFTLPNASATILTDNAAVTVAQGGTGIASGTSGGIPYFSGATTIASSAALAANQLVLGGGAGVTPATLGSLGTTTTVLHGNASGAPTFGAVSLTADVTGILPGAQGGTNNGNMAFTGPASTLKTFTLPNASATILTDNALVTAAQGGTNNGFTQFSGPASSTKTFTLPNASATILTDNAAVTVAQGGTGITSGTSGGIPYFSGSTTMASSAALTANALVKGGGAGAAPVATGITVDDTTNAIYGQSVKQNQQTGTTYTLQASDNGKVVEISNAGAITLTLPNSLAAGFACTIVQTGAGQITCSAASGATLNSASSFTKARAQYSMLSLYVQANSNGTSAVYILGGDGA